MKKLLLTLAAIAIGFSSQAANATVLTFDDYDPTITGLQHMDQVYGGFEWGLTGVNNVTHYTDKNNGYVHGTVTDNFVAYNRYASSLVIKPADGGTFTFNGAYFTSAWRAGMSLVAIGYSNEHISDPFNMSGEAYRQIVGLSFDNPTWFDFNFENINELELRAWGGTDIPNLDGHGAYFAMDNFTFNAGSTPTPAPEPTTMLLGLMGMAGAARLRRNK